MFRILIQNRQYRISSIRRDINCKRGAYNQVYTFKVQTLTAIKIFRCLLLQEIFVFLLSLSVLFCKLIAVFHCHSCLPYVHRISDTVSLLFSLQYNILGFVYKRVICKIFFLLLIICQYCSTKLTCFGQDEHTWMRTQNGNTWSVSILKSACNRNPQTTYFYNLIGTQ